MSSSNKDLKSEIDSLRYNLLDLSANNKFLNFNWYIDALPIIDVDFFDIFSKLVHDNKELELTFEKPIDELEELFNNDKLTDRIEKDIVKKTIERIEKFGNPDNAMEYFSQNTLSLFKKPDYYIDRTNDFVLNTPLNKIEFDSLLNQMDLKYQKDLFLDGIPKLFLALGFLEYGDSYAPLIFIPVVLENRDNKYYIKLNGSSELKLNKYLKLKLEEKDLILPSNDIKIEEDMIKYLTKVNHIIPDEFNLKPLVALSLFDFKNINLYEDLNINNLSEFSRNELNYYFSENSEEEEESFIPSKIDENSLDSIDEKLKYNVFTPDSSQESIIEEAKLGGNILVDTHSATNKSETIINLISNIIANKKTVLYISDKIEAINEIKSKLDEVGLNIAYLDLYGANYNINQLITEIIRSADYNSKDLYYNPKYFNIKVENSNNLINKINSYFDFIHSPYKKTNIAPYVLLGLKESNLAEIERLGKEVKLLKMENLSDLNEEELEELFEEVAHISNIYIGKIAPATEHQFKEYNVNISDEDFSNILNSISQLNDLIIELIDLIKSLHEEYGVKELEKLEDDEEYFDNLDILAKNPYIMGKDYQNLLDYIDSLEKLQIKIKEYGSIDELERSLTDELIDSKKDFEYYVEKLNDLKGRINDYNSTLNNFKENLKAAGLKELNSLNEIKESLNKLDLLMKNPAIVENEEELDKFIDDIGLYQKENAKNPLIDLIKSINSDSVNILNQTLNEINDILLLESNIQEVNNLIVEFNNLKEEIGFIKLNSIDEINENIIFCDLLIKKPVLIEEGDDLDQFYNIYKKGSDKFSSSSYMEHYESFKKEFVEIQTNVTEEVSKSSILESRLIIYEELKNLKEALEKLSIKTATKNISCLNEVDEYLDKIDLLLMNLKQIDEKDEEKIYAYIQLIKEKQQNESYFNYPISDIERTINDIIFIQKTLFDLNYDDMILKEDFNQYFEFFKRDYSKLKMSPIEIVGQDKREDLKKDLETFKKIKDSLLHRFSKKPRIKNELKSYYKYNAPEKDELLLIDYENYFKMEANVKKYLHKLKRFYIGSNGFYDDYAKIDRSFQKLVSLKDIYEKTESLIHKYVPNADFYNNALEELFIIKFKLEEANNSRNMDYILGKYFPNSYNGFDTDLDELYEEYRYLDEFNKLCEENFFNKEINIENSGIENDIFNIDRIKSKIYNFIKWVNLNVDLKDSILNLNTIFSLDFDVLIDYCEKLYAQIKTSNDLFNEYVEISNLENIESVYNNLENVSSFEEMKFICDVSSFKTRLFALKEDYELLEEYYSLEDNYANLIQRYYDDIWQGLKTPSNDIKKKNKDCRIFSQLYNENVFSNNILDNSTEENLNKLKILSNYLKTKISSFDKELVFYDDDLSKICFNDIKNQNSIIFKTFDLLKTYEKSLSSYDVNNLIRFKIKSTDSIEDITVSSIDNIDDFSINSEKYLSATSIEEIKSLSNLLDDFFNDCNKNNIDFKSLEKSSLNYINLNCDIFKKNIRFRDSINSREDIINNHFYHKNVEFNKWFGSLSNLDELKEKVKVDKEFTNAFKEGFFNEKTIELIKRDPNIFNIFLDEEEEYFNKLNKILNKINSFDLIREEYYNKLESLELIKRNPNIFNKFLYENKYDKKLDSLLKLIKPFESIKNEYFIKLDFNDISQILKVIESELIKIADDFSSISIDENQNLFDFESCTDNIEIIEKISDYEFIKSLKEKIDILENHKKALNTKKDNLNLLYYHKFIFDSKNIDEKYFKYVNKSYDTDVSKLKEQIDINLKYEKLHEDGFFNPNTERIFIVPEEYEKFDQIKNHLYDLINEIIFNLDIVDTLYNNEESYLKTELSDLYSLLHYLENNKSDLTDWRDFRIYSADCDDISQDFVKSLNNDEIDKEIVYETFRYNFANNFLNEIKNDDFSIKSEDIDHYKGLNNEIIGLNRLRILNNLNENRPDFEDNNFSYASYKSFSILNKEFDAKHTKKSIKNFLKDSIDYVKFIKPIFLMNPYSVSEYLDFKKFDSYFDYVIYDDISNTTIENSLSSLFRAKNKIIFSNGKINSNSDLFNLLKSKYINKSLNWAILDNESLLEFSNKHYYNNELIFYKSPEVNFESGLKLKFIKDSRFNKESKENILEAEEIVKYVLNHFEYYGNTKSLGIIAFTNEQKELILKRLKEYTELNEYLDSLDLFFINDIYEVYQTRDIVLVSFTYGKDEDEKLNIDIPFENNYLINLILTRSREKTILFTNFKSKDIVINKDSTSSDKEIKDLFEYIDYERLYDDGRYYEKLNRDFINLEKNKPELSIFENYIYDFLTNEGYVVKKQYGICGNFIDLVVADKKDINKNLLAISCDKTNYEIFNTINDREIFYVNQLENLGWNHYHIYASEWYENPEESKKNLLNEINKAIDNVKLSDFGVDIGEEDIIDYEKTDRYEDIEFGEDIWIELDEEIDLAEDIEIELDEEIELIDDVEIEDIEIDIDKLISDNNPHLSPDEQVDEYVGEEEKAKKSSDWSRKSEKNKELSDNLEVEKADENSSEKIFEYDSTVVKDGESKGEPEDQLDKKKSGNSDYKKSSFSVSTSNKSSKKSSSKESKFSSDGSEIKKDGQLSPIDILNRSNEQVANEGKHPIDLAGGLDYLKTLIRQGHTKKFIAEQYRYKTSSPIDTYLKKHNMTFAKLKEEVMHESKKL